MAERDDLARELRALTDEINAAYWRFTRCRNAAPPSIAARAAWDRRNVVRARLRELDAAEGGTQ